MQFHFELASKYPGMIDPDIKTNCLESPSSLRMAAEEADDMPAMIREGI